jgi:hypothetical protein
MKLLNYGQRLYAPVNDGSEGGASGAGSPAVFDQAAFSAQILGDVSKAITAQLKTFKADLAKAPVVKAADVIDPNPDIDHAAGVVKPSSDPALAAQFKALERQNKLLLEQFGVIQKQAADTNAAAETKERHSSIRDTLAGFQFGSDAQRDTAFRIFRDDIRREADGSLVGGADGAPLKEFVTEQMKNHSYLLAVKDVGSAGARGGRVQGGVKAVDLDSIRPGMSAADLAAASAEISAALLGR